MQVQVASTSAKCAALIVPVRSETVKIIRNHYFKVSFAYAHDGGDITSSMNVARVGERLVREIPTKECRWKSNDRLQQGISKKIAIPVKRVGPQVSSIERDPPPPPMTWRVPLLPTLSPLNCSHNQESNSVKMVSSKEDDRGNDSHSIDSSCEEAVNNNCTTCREPATSAHHDKERHSNGDHGSSVVYDNDDHACQDTHAESEEHSRSIIKARSLMVPRPALAAPMRACPGPEDADRDSSCNSAVFISTRIKGLTKSLREMQPASARFEGVAATSRTLPTASPSQRVPSQHAKKRWTTTHQPDALTLTARSRESNERRERNNRREELLETTDSQPHRLKDNSKLTHIDKIEARCPSRVPAAPLPRVHHPRPRPLWLALRKRTLKITQEDPSIFSPSVSSLEPQSRANIAPASTAKGCWHIINRRIFGTHEMSRCEKGIQPEWIIFGGGIPALDTTDQDR